MSDTKLDPLSILAIHRIAAIYPADVAKAELGAGTYNTDTTVHLTGEIRLGESYESDNVNVAWLDVASAALAELDPQQRENFLRRFERSLQAGSSTVEPNARLKRALRRRALKVHGRRINSGKLTGKLSASKV